MCGVQNEQETINKKDSLFFIQLEHFEGELKVGLGFRTFNKHVDDDQSQQYQIQWFTRTNDLRHSWGETPSFKHAKVGDGRRLILSKSVEDFCNFLPVIVKLSRTKSRDPAKQGCTARLTKECLDALRMYARSHDLIRDEAPACSAAPRARSKAIRACSSDESSFDKDDDDEESEFSFASSPERMSSRSPPSEDLDAASEPDAPVPEKQRRRSGR